jgi:hypothetical protein
MLKYTDASGFSSLSKNVNCLNLVEFTGACHDFIGEK